MLIALPILMAFGGVWFALSPWEQQRKMDAQRWREAGLVPPGEEAPRTQPRADAAWDERQAA
ncbi:MAG TPA: hypothetical protein VLW45_02815 [Pelomicrobium sp.]|nr:hypothetical protein [Pelomicrobium sp.]